MSVVPSDEGVELLAAVITEAGRPPVVTDFDEPEPAGDAVIIDVRTAALGGWDISGAYRLGVEYPCVIRGEGVGHTKDGRRVYFGERSLLPFGAWAECTAVPAPEVWDVPDGIDDKLAIAVGIAGTGALVPLQQADIKPGENVLILGATGTLGQIALQLARYFGAGRVVAAGRDKAALESAVERGLADDFAQLGAGDDTAAVKEVAGQGFDVVLDGVYGAPFLAALKASRFGARIMTISGNAGMTATVELPDMLFRTHTCVGTGQRPPEDRYRLWRQLLDIATKSKFVLDYAEYSLADAPQAWRAQQQGPHAKVLGMIR